MKVCTTLLLAFFCTLLLATSQMSAQCTGQDSLDCTCEALTAKSLTICIGGTNYNVTIFSCEQVATTQPIRNPCFYPQCNGPQDRVSWVKKICFPVGSPPHSPTAVYNAIICATDLCTNDYLGISGSFPTCDAGKDACDLFNFGVYCHTIALPKCVKWNGLCLEICDEECDQHCYVQRRYCKQGDDCKSCDINICEDPDAENCPGSCTTVDCEDLSWSACCP